MRNLSSSSAFRVIKFESGTESGVRKYAIIYEGDSFASAYDVYMQCFRELYGFGNLYELHVSDGSVWEVVSSFYWAF